MGVRGGCHQGREIVGLRPPLASSCEIERLVPHHPSPQAPPPTPNAGVRKKGEGSFNKPRVDSLPKPKRPKTVPKVRCGSSVRLPRLIDHTRIRIDTLRTGRAAGEGEEAEEEEEEEGAVEGEDQRPGTPELHTHTHTLLDLKNANISFD